MRLWMLIGTMLLSGAVLEGPTHRYRVEIEDTTTYDDGGNPFTDTSFVSAVVSVSTADSAGAMVATFVIDSASTRHTLRASSPFAVPDLTAAGTTARFRVAAGRLDSALSLSYGGYPPGLSIAPVVAIFHYFFPALRPTAKSGDQWSDTTRANGATTISAWSVVSEQQGLFNAHVLDKTTSSARSPEGAQVTSEATTSRDITSTRAGPVSRATIRRQTHLNGSDPADPRPLSFTRSVVTRIVELR